MCDGVGEQSTDTTKTTLNVHFCAPLKSGFSGVFSRVTVLIGLPLSPFLSEIPSVTDSPQVISAEEPHSVGRKTGPLPRYPITPATSPQRRSLLLRGTDGTSACGFF